MRKIITKAVVVEALRKESLSRGRYFHRSPNVLLADGDYEPNCNVCAVGAVLRHVSFETWARKKKLRLNSVGSLSTKLQGASYDSEVVAHINRLLRAKNYLGALSNYFEGGKTAEECVAFVEKNFPKKFSLTITPKEVRRYERTPYR